MVKITNTQPKCARRVIHVLNDACLRSVPSTRYIIIYEAMGCSGFIHTAGVKSVCVLTFATLKYRCISCGDHFFLIRNHHKCLN